MSTRALDRMHIVRWQVFVGAILVVQLAGCRDLLGIHEMATVEDAGAADVVNAPDTDAAPVTGPTFCDTLAPPAQHCSDFEKGDPGAGWDAQGLLPDPAIHGGGTLGELRIVGVAAGELLAEAA